MLFIVHRFLHPDDGGVKFLRNVVLTRATRRNIPEDGILHSHCCGNLKSYKRSDASPPRSGVIIAVRMSHSRQTEILPHVWVGLYCFVLNSILHWAMNQDPEGPEDTILPQLAFLRKWLSGLMFWAAMSLCLCVSLSAVSSDRRVNTFLINAIWDAARRIPAFRMCYLTSLPRIHRSMKLTSAVRGKWDL
jgi:hypothetical protein